MTLRKGLGSGVVVAVVAAIATITWWAQRGAEPTSDTNAESGRVAVAAAPVETGELADERTFTGTLEAGAAFTVAPKTGGQVERVHVDIGDRVEQGQVVVALEDAEPRLAVAEAEAALAVARAEVEQAQADARLARRDLERTQSMAERDLASASELDTARAQAEARAAAVAVARARVQQREAALERARVQRGQTRIRADWRGGDSERVVGERMVNPGDTVAANTPLLSVLGIAPITAVAFAPEDDYARLSKGQAVRVTADALPGRTFAGRISRIAPRFETDSRQARFEVTLANNDRVLKPGMFVTLRATVATATGATLVPTEAIVRRDGEPGVYRLSDEEPPQAHFVSVELGIEGPQRVQVLEPALSGRVVTLGQQLLEDGAAVIVSELPAS